MGEYINLMLASKLGHNDAPQVVLDRYQSTKPQVKVNFVVTATTVTGEYMDLVGETPVLGDNNEQAAIRLKPLHYPKWNVSVSLPAGAHYKCHFFKHVPGQANVEGATFDVFADPRPPGSGRSEIVSLTTRPMKMLARFSSTACALCARGGSLHRPGACGLATKRHRRHKKRDLSSAISLARRSSFGKDPNPRKSFLLCRLCIFVAIHSSL